MGSKSQVRWTELSVVKKQRPGSGGLSAACLLFGASLRACSLEPLCRCSDPYPPLPGMLEPWHSCAHLQSVALQRAGSARAGCWPTQVKTLPLGSPMAVRVQVALLGKVGPGP